MMCGETFCVCGNCIPDGPVLYANEGYLAKHPETVVIPPSGKCTCPCIHCSNKAHWMCQTCRSS